MAKKSVKKSAAKKVTKTVTKKSAPKKAAKTAAKKSTTKKAQPKADYKPTALMSDIEYLMQMMVAHDVTEVEVEEKSGRKIEIKRGTVAAPVVAAAPAPVAAAPIAAAPAAAAQAPAAPAAPAVDEGLVEIKSPMVGTFYAAPSPDSDDYVKVGASVGSESVVCIVEAMKVMNEIKAETSGTIAEICVKNADPVEFGQVLYKVRPN